MLEKNKIAQKREKRLIEVLSIFCVFVFMSSLFHNITLCYDLGKDDTHVAHGILLSLNFQNTF